MKYRIEVSEEQLRVIGLAVDEYMRLRMGQFDAFAEELALDGVADESRLIKMIISAVFLTSGATASKECLRLLTKWPIRRMDAVDGSTIHGERVSTLYTPSSTSSGWTVRKTSGKSRAQQTVLSNLFRWGMSRSRKLRGWKNELPVL